MRIRDSASSERNSALQAADSRNLAMVFIYLEYEFCHHVDWWFDWLFGFNKICTPHSLVVNHLFNIQSGVADAWHQTSVTLSKILVLLKKMIYYAMPDGGVQNCAGERRAIWPLFSVTVSQSRSRMISRWWNNQSVFGLYFGCPSEPSHHPTSCLYPSIHALTLFKIYISHELLTGSKPSW